MRSPNTGEGKFDAPVVFVGYGISQPEEYKYDDYAGIDVKGKVVLAMRYEPRDEKGKSRFSGEEAWSSAASITSKASEAEKRGAIALLLVSPPNELGGTIAPAATPASTLRPRRRTHRQRHRPHHRAMRREIRIG